MKGHTHERSVTVAEIVDALLLFDEPMLNSRYHAMLSRISRDPAREALGSLPGLVMRSIHSGRLGAFEWMRTRRPVEMDAEFLRRTERVLIEAFLTCAEEQLRLIAFLARGAPNREARRHFDSMADDHRAVVKTLRGTLGGGRGNGKRVSGASLRSVQEEDDVGDLRGQLEDAIVQSREKGVPLRTIFLSHTALRHLRDQGAFADGDATVLGVPVSVDLGWDAPAFVLQTLEVVPLEEILRTE